MSSMPLRAALKRAKASARVLRSVATTRRRASPRAAPGSRSRCRGPTRGDRPPHGQLRQCDGRRVDSGHPVGGFLDRRKVGGQIVVTVRQEPDFARTPSSSRRGVRLRPAYPALTARRLTTRVASTGSPSTNSRASTENGSSATSRRRWIADSPGAAESCPAPSAPSIRSTVKSARSSALCRRRQNRLVNLRRRWWAGLPITPVTGRDRSRAPLTDPRRWHRRSVRLWAWSGCSTAIAFLADQLSARRCRRSRCYPAGTGLRPRPVCVTATRPLGGTGCGPRSWWSCRSFWTGVATATCVSRWRSSCARPSVLARSRPERGCRRRALAAHLGVSRATVVRRPGRTRRRRLGGVAARLGHVRHSRGRGGPTRADCRPARAT